VRYHGSLELHFLLGTIPLLTIVLIVIFWHIHSDITDKWRYIALMPAMSVVVIVAFLLFPLFTRAFYPFAVYEKVFSRLFFAPNFFGNYVDFKITRYSDSYQLGDVFGIIAMIVGWYLPLALFTIKNPPMTKSTRIGFLIGIAIIWLTPAIMFARSY